MSMKKLIISCRTAAVYICKKEEGSLTFWQRFQLSYHLLVCGVCRTFEQQDHWLRNNVNKVDEHCKGCLSTEEKQHIISKLKEEVSS